MATYFEAINDEGKTTLNDTNSVLCITRKASLKDIFGDYSYYNYSDTISRYRSLNFNGTAMACYVFVDDITLNEGEVAIAVHHPMCDCNCACINISSGVVRMWATAPYPYDKDSFESYLKSIEILFLGDRMDNSNMIKGLELFDKNGKRIYQSTDRVVDVRGMYQTLASKYISKISNLGTALENLGRLCDTGITVKDTDGAFVFNSVPSGLCVAYWHTNPEFILWWFCAPKIFNSHLYISFFVVDLNLPIGDSGNENLGLLLIKRW